MDGRRIIDANHFLEKMKKTNRYFDVKFDIEEEPTVNLETLPLVQELRRELMERELAHNHLYAHWNYEDCGEFGFRDDEWKCSKCGFTVGDYCRCSKPTKFCPGCGAKMIADDEEAEKTAKREKEIISFLKHYEEEEKKESLGGMVWDEVNWEMYYLSHDYHWTDEDLIREFPALTGGGKYMIRQD